MPCRCLLEDMPDQAELLRAIRELIGLMPADERSPDAEKDARLSRCRACEHLISGTCALCGCYVQLRASKASMACPDVPPRWPSLPLPMT